MHLLENKKCGLMQKKFRRNKKLSILMGKVDVPNKAHVRDQSC